MFLNVGGAVLGVALLTLVSDTVAFNKGGESSSSARLDGYRAGYYTCIGMCALGFVISIPFKSKEDAQVPQGQDSAEEESEST